MNSLRNPTSIIRRAAKYRDRGLCATALTRAGHNYIAVMGDDCTYWIVTKREAGILRRAGYEIDWTL